MHGDETNHFTSTISSPREALLLFELEVSEFVPQTAYCLGLAFNFSNGVPMSEDHTKFSRRYNMAMWLV